MTNPVKPHEAVVPDPNIQ
ncbi:hypothetical protein A2U01_0072734, partial [Trifolium medium]|nr:hypothetical protein [Trifolium medium]